MQIHAYVDNVIVFVCLFTCVQRQMSRKSLLSTEHLATDRTREELFIQSPLGNPVSRLPIILF